MADMTWRIFEDQVQRCMMCRLCNAIRHKVPGDGSHDSPVMFIGEGPGENEDLQGLPFVGAAGQLLTNMLASVGIDRQKVYICNIVKCRPPRNRVPEPDEAAACMLHLRNQTALLKPRIIVLLGSTACRYTLRPDFRITKERGQWVERKGVWMLPTYHPSALLRDESKKYDAWADMKALRDKLKELELYDRVSITKEEEHG